MPNGNVYLLAAGLAGFAYTGNAHAIPTAVQNMASGLCMDVYGGSNNNGAAIIQYGCNGATNQRWKIDLQNEYYAMRSDDSERCLDVPKGRRTPGTNVSQYNCNKDENQDFVIRLQGSGFVIMARHSGLCLGVEGKTAAAQRKSGARIEQQKCNNSRGQIWNLPGFSAASKQGRWGPVDYVNLVPAAGANLPDGKVLLWSSSNRNGFNNEEENNNRTYSTIYDPRTGNADPHLEANTAHNMFCPAISNLADGRILVSGGSTSKAVSIFDPRTNRWANGQDMKVGRGYHGGLTLSTGDVFTIGGSWSGGKAYKNGEIWRERTGNWQFLGNVNGAAIMTNDKSIAKDGPFRADNHAWLFAAANGRVFHAGPSRKMHWIDTRGNGDIDFAGYRGKDRDAMNGNAVMYAPKFILTVGGATDYDDSPASRNANIIDISTDKPKVTGISPMRYPRAFHNSVVLPDAKVVVVGGIQFAKTFSDDGAVMVPELYDPATRTFQPMARMAVPRTYHSIAMLLPDGRVLAGGGGLCWVGRNPCNNHSNVEIWSPPYLFAPDGSPARRPAVVSAPDMVKVGATFRVRTSNSAISKFTLVRMSSVTHSVNNEQRRLPVAFREVGDDVYSLDLPDNPGDLVPGYYMLFALNAQGVPSVAHSIRID